VWQRDMTTSSELTVRAMVLGLVLAVALGAANAYVGLFAGMTVCASIPAAVISLGVLRVLGGGNVRENNIVQTAASAGEALAAGAIFTLPALVLMGVWREFPWGGVTAITAVGGMLGVLFTVPLRRALVARGALAFPEGVATAHVLRAGHRMTAAVAGEPRTLAVSALGGAVMKFAQQALHAWEGTWERAVRFGSTSTVVGVDLSPALLGVGYICGIRVALCVCAGGAIAWLCGVPLATALRAPGEGEAAAAAFAAWRGSVRYLGVGAMIVGGIHALAHVAAPVYAALHQRTRAAGNGAAPSADERDMPAVLVMAGVALVVIPIAWYAYVVLDGAARAAVMTVAVVLLGFLFSAVAAYMAGLVGSSNNPISGITLAAMLITALVLMALVGRAYGGGAACAVMIGALVCCAAAIAGDVMQDLKTGQLVGATPWKQQVMEMAGVLATALVISTVLNILHRAYGIGSASLSAPQATLIKAVAEGVFHGALPWGWMCAGGALALVACGVDEYLRVRHSTRFPVLALAVGMYLPFSLSITIVVGGVIGWLARGRGTGERAHEPGVLCASGFITGEALTGIAVAVPIFLTGNAEWWPHVGGMAWAGPLLYVAAVLALWRVGRRATHFYRDLA